MEETQASKNGKERRFRFGLARVDLFHLFMGVSAVAGGWFLATHRARLFLVVWLAVALFLGISISIFPKDMGITRRVSRLALLYAVLVGAGVWFTQQSARRSIEGAHIVYSGAIIQKSDSIIVGTESTADFSLPRSSSTQPAWALLFTRVGSAWKISPLRGAEQIRIYTRVRRGKLDLKAYSIANAAVIEDGQRIFVRNDSQIVDTITPAKREGKWELKSTALGGFLSLEPKNAALKARFVRRLRTGTSLSNLDGSRIRGAAHERFLTLQRIGKSEALNGTGNSFLKSRDVLVLSASSPYRITGTTVDTLSGIVPDSAMVEVRSGGTVWRLKAQAYRIRMKPQKAILFSFVKNPTPLDVALPTGENCSAGAPCGMISLEKLPPPIPHVWLGEAGLTAGKYGLLATLRQDGRDINATTARLSVRMRAGQDTLLPAVSFANSSDTAFVQLRAKSSLGATNFEIFQIVLVPELVLLLGAFWTFRRRKKREIAGVAICLGLNAILGLLLTRLIIGSRVTFFPPFEERGIQTGIGMWVASAIVVVGLLKWPLWASRILSNANRLFTRQAHKVPIGKLVLAIFAGGVLIFVLKGILPTAQQLIFFQPLLKGLVTGLTVVTLWFILAWTLAFCSAPFHEFQSAWGVITFSGSTMLPVHRDSTAIVAQQSSGNLPSVWNRPMPALGLARRISQLPAQLLEDLSVMAVVACAALSAYFGGTYIAGILFAATVLLVIWLIYSPAPTTNRRPLAPLILGIVFVSAVFAFLRGQSENGATPYFALVILIALVGVRAGRRLRGGREAARSMSWRYKALRLFTLGIPLLALLPFLKLDAGLFLVVTIPVALAVGLAAGWRGLLFWERGAFLLFVGVFILLVKTLLYPNLAGLRVGSYSDKATAFHNLIPFGLGKIPYAADPVARAAARAVATYDQRLAESLLISAGPGTSRDLLVPSIEQIWGAKSYAAKGGLMGIGFGQAPVGSGGIAKSVSFAENSYSVFVLAENGYLAGLVILSFYGLLVIAVAIVIWNLSYSLTESDRANRALVLVATLLFVCPAAYVALSNLSVLPITGQNMPFLGLNAWSDVMLCAGGIGILLTGVNEMGPVPREE